MWINSINYIELLRKDRAANCFEAAVLGAILLSVVPEFLLIEFRYLYLIMLGCLLIGSVGA